MNEDLILQEILYFINPYIQLADIDDTLFSSIKTFYSIIFNPSTNLEETLKSFHQFIYQHRYTSEKYYRFKENILHLIAKFKSQPVYLSRSHVSRSSQDEFAMYVQDSSPSVASHTIKGPLPHSSHHSSEEQSDILYLESREEDQQQSPRQSHLPDMKSQVPSISRHSEKITPQSDQATSSESSKPSALIPIDKSREEDQQQSPRQSHLPDMKSQVPSISRHSEKITPQSDQATSSESSKPSALIPIDSFNAQYSKHRMFPKSSSKMNFFQRAIHKTKLEDFYANGLKFSNVEGIGKLYPQLDQFFCTIFPRSRFPSSSSSSSPHFPIKARQFTDIKKKSSHTYSILFETIEDATMAYYAFEQHKSDRVFSQFGSGLKVKWAWLSKDKEELMKQSKIIRAKKKAKESIAVDGSSQASINRYTDSTSSNDLDELTTSTLGPIASTVDGAGVILCQHSQDNFENFEDLLADEMDLIEFEGLSEKEARRLKGVRQEKRVSARQKLKTTFNSKISQIEDVFLTENYRLQLKIEEADDFFKKYETEWLFLDSEYLMKVFNRSSSIQATSSSSSSSFSSQSSKNRDKRDELDDKDDLMIGLGDVVDEERIKMIFGRSYEYGISKRSPSSFDSLEKERKEEEEEEIEMGKEDEFALEEPKHVTISVAAAWGSYFKNAFDNLMFLKGEFERVQKDYGVRLAHLDELADDDEIKFKEKYIDKDKTKKFDPNILSLHTITSQLHAMDSIVESGGSSLAPISEFVDPVHSRVWRIDNPPDSFLEDEKVAIFGCEAIVRNVLDACWKKQQEDQRKAAEEEEERKAEVAVGSGCDIDPINIIAKYSQNIGEILNVTLSSTIFRTSSASSINPVYPHDSYLRLPFAIPLQHSSHCDTFSSSIFSEHPLTHSRPRCVLAVESTIINVRHVDEKVMFILLSSKHVASRIFNEINVSFCGMSLKIRPVTSLVSFGDVERKLSQNLLAGLRKDKSRKTRKSMDKISANGRRKKIPAKRKQVNPGRKNKK
ncbi:hypothetical protein ADUPG1_013861 [Aduncisulcus paluster]|uniref:Uncharacterized protein n=1 Tax=Aduncisulcus paluster TaxID=2918883 RepID=A0ABQ5K9C3_9EUKA|nr:hypothetical protein ADUPG1_013861 [Aduncisulcus paluster]